jgi:DNA polymerase III delta prime subunit
MCGNKRSLRLFRRWLQMWLDLDDYRAKQREKKRRRSGGSALGRKSIGNNERNKNQRVSPTLSRSGSFGRSGSEDSGSDCSDIESDFSDEGSSELAKIFIFEGPSGCGKSSAVYACAQEYGFEVKEENTQECRSGAAVKRRVLETSQSRYLAVGGDAQTLSSQPATAAKMKLILFDEV